jgi:hypothetical protein
MADRELELKGESAGDVAPEAPAQRRAHWLAEGPDPVDEAEPPGLLEVLLPWPVRCLVVLLAFAGAWFWRNTGYGQQLSWGLQVGALASMAIVSALWWQVLLVDSALAALWFLPFRPAERKLAWSALHVITFLNRQIGHVWALLVWFVIALAAVARLPWQLGGAVAVLLLGAPLLNGLARRPWPLLGPDATGKATGDLLWRRRLLIYAVTLLGLVALVLAAPGQFSRLLPLILALFVGMVLRAVRHWLRTRKVSAELRAGRSSVKDLAQLEAREKFRRTQAKVARGADPCGAVLVPLVLASLVAFSWWQQDQVTSRLRAAQSGPAYDATHCGRDARAPQSSDVALFLLADAQTHELGGTPYPGETEIAQVFVSAASRPIALDMLSSVPIQQAASVYAQLQAQRPKGASPLLWAHLGDLADLACRQELQHLLSTLAAFQGPLAGIALGNHEMSFQGSFHWSPYWDGACASGKLDKDTASREVQAAFGSALAASRGGFLRLTSPFGSARGGSLSAVTPLGIARHSGRQRGLIGIFLDTSDGRAFDWGMPGSVGAVSQAQLDVVRGATARLREERGGPYAADPAYLVLQHVPYSQLAGASQARVAAWVTELDERHGNLGSQPRVLAFLSAHTHAAGAQQHCIGNRYVREITIGSTTDPPEQAALAEIGEDARGNLALSLRTLQAVEREGATCGSAPGTAAAACRHVAYQLAREPACRGVLGTGPSEEAPRDCQELEQSESLPERFASLQMYAGPRDTQGRRRFHELQAEQLLACVCRDGCEPLPAQPLAGDAYWATFQQLWARPERREELSCLAWAASACQAHKSSAMTLGEALRCSFDDSSLPAERVYVATLEPSTCF